MTTLGSYNPGNLKVLLLGPSGSGKTCLATSLGARAVVLDANAGLASAQSLQDAFHDQRQLCEVKQCWGPGGPGVMWKKLVGYINSYAQTPPVDRPALVIDSLSDLAEASLGSVLQLKNKWDETDPPNTTMGEWGTAISQVQRILWTLKSIPALVVVCGHTKLIEQDGVSKEALSIYGKALPGQIAATFDEIWYLKTSGYGDKRKRFIQSQSTGGIECKTRRQLPESSDLSLGLEGLLGLIGWKFPASGEVKT